MNSIELKGSGNMVPFEFHTSKEYDFLTIIPYTKFGIVENYIRARKKRHRKN